MRSRDLLRTRENRKPGEYGRTVAINIRVSPEERAMLKCLAADRGLSVGAYLISLALPEGLNTEVPSPK